MLADLFYYHGMIPFNVWQQWHQSGCVGTTADPPLHCQLLGKQIQIMSGVPDMVDPDNLYTDQCTGNASLEVDPVTSSCSQFQLRRNLWLNRVDVQAAIHARNFYWVPCTNSSSVLNYTSDWPNMLPYYAQFTSQKPSMRILIYSGDVDSMDPVFSPLFSFFPTNVLICAVMILVATVPHAYTQMCIHEMNRTVVSDWRPWKIENALAGYTQDFEGLSFATVKGAGHEVPMFSPRAAFEMVQRFLFNQKL
ncbi:MAG: hypothetical protein Q8P67_02650 [archaeon]|nr:hypothetical protein [archaeon]